MASLASLRLHADGVIAALTADGVVVGDGDKPSVPYGARPEAGGSPAHFIAYCIVYPMPGTYDGTLAEQNDDADLVYQVTCVGATRDACQLVEDRVNTALLAGAITVTGRSITQVRLDIGGGVRRDDTVQPPVFISTPRYRVSSTPA
jgi:hypothetical protein